ncbi:uncharacterized protein G2W53_022030 [Senna tora]|uniref:Uncharacterized protein n=1 Tax=Senna tora TaxID=362788 RepID=A0A834TMZ3_9FABA|nr:uncharacterized protein G2W53_022030 [Senna tora]
MGEGGYGFGALRGRKEWFWDERGLEYGDGGRGMVLWVRRGRRGVTGLGNGEEGEWCGFGVTVLVAWWKGSMGVVAWWKGSMGVVAGKDG